MTDVCQDKGHSSYVINNRSACREAYDSPNEPMNLTDEDLIDEILAGDKELFGELVSRYQRPVYNLMKRYTRNTEKAMDLSQDVFVRAFDHLRSYRTGQQFFSWLYAIAVNRAKDWSRTAARRRKLIDSYGTVTGEGGPAGEQHSRMEARELEVSLDLALAGLSETTREILLFRYRHDRSIRDTAMVFKMSESAVKMRIKRGLEELEQILEKAGIDGRKVFS